VKIWMQLVLGLLALFVAACLLSSLLGLVMHLAIGVGILACILGVIGYLIRGWRQRQPPAHVTQRRAEKTADRALKDLERKVNKQ
jgi:hypothetical protein